MLLAALCLLAQVSWGLALSPGDALPGLAITVVAFDGVLGTWGSRRTVQVWWWEEQQEQEGLVRPEGR